MLRPEPADDEPQPETHESIKRVAAIELAEAIAGIQRGLESMYRGEGRPLDEAFAALRRKHSLPD